MSKDNRTFDVTKIAIYALAEYTQEDYGGLWMITKKLLTCSIAILCLTSAANSKTVFGVDNAYKNQRHEARFQQSSFSKFRTQLNKTVDDLEQKTEDLEDLNQKLEGRVDTLNGEKDKLSKTCAQMKVKQTMLEQDQARLKKKTSSLEVAYKSRANKNKVATASKKQKPVAKKSAIPKAPQTKTSAKSSKKGQKTTAKKPTPVKTAESTPSPQQAPVIAPIEREPVEKHPAERQAVAMSGDSDVKKINEKGIEYGKQGKYDEAIKEFQKVAAMDPNIANVHYNLGLAYKKKGMDSEAKKEFAAYERLNKEGR